jgi:hypothetical protein
MVPMRLADSQRFVKKSGIALLEGVIAVFADLQLSLVQVFFSNFTLPPTNSIIEKFLWDRNYIHLKIL